MEAESSSRFRSNAIELELDSAGSVESSAVIPATVSKSSPAGSVESPSDPMTIRPRTPLGTRNRFFFHQGRPGRVSGRGSIVASATDKLDCSPNCRPDPVAIAGGCGSSRRGGGGDTFSVQAVPSHQRERPGDLESSYQPAGGGGFTIVILISVESPCLCKGSMSIGAHNRPYDTSAKSRRKGRLKSALPGRITQINPRP